MLHHLHNIYVSILRAVQEPAFWAAVSSVATVIYVIVSFLLFRATMRAANEARVASEFNRRLVEAAERPFVAGTLSLQRRRVEENRPRWYLSVQLRNHSISAGANSVEARASVNWPGNKGWEKLPEVSALSLVPQESVEVDFPLERMDEENTTKNPDYVPNLVILDVSYAGITPQPYTYKRMFGYLAAEQMFFPLIDAHASENGANGSKTNGAKAASATAGNFFYNGTQQALCRALPISAQRLEQSLFAEFFASIVERVGDAVGVEREH